MTQEANEQHVDRPTDAPIPYGVIWRRLVEGKGVWSHKDPTFLPDGTELARRVDLRRLTATDSRAGSPRI